MSAVGTGWIRAGATRFKRALPIPLKRAGLRAAHPAVIAAQWTHYRRRLRRATPVLVHHMGKVGSTSTHRTVAAAWPGVVLKAHRFPDHEDWRVRDLYRRTVERGLPLKVISLAREPIARNVSTFFQVFDRVTGVRFADSDFSVAELRRMFLSNLDHSVPLEWFDRNTNRFFGIDVYSAPFPAAGHLRLSKGNVDLLLLRLECPDDVKLQAIREFLDLPELHMLRDNVGERKVYRDTYDRFKAEVTLPAEYVDAMCGSRYSRHFYSPLEIQAVRESWLEPQRAEGS